MVSRTKMDTRTRILKATWDLLETGQGQGVRMSDIARHAGVSRQAVYLHFGTRAELLIATTLYVDELNDSDARLAASRAAASGVERLDAFIEAWGGYIPMIYGMARALIAMSDTDEAAAAAWGQRMQDMREGCEAAILALKADGRLNAAHSPEQATDLLWTALSVANWEQLTITCNWSQSQYIESIKTLAHQAFVVAAL